MSDDKPSRDSIFCAAIEIAEEKKRAAYVAQACGDDVALRKQVANLVAAHFRAGSFLQNRVEPETISKAVGGVAIGTILAGKYKLIEAVGGGGMGDVYMAQQGRPVKRLVAIKVIKAGTDSKPVLARFDAERQALAMMDHPNIARVFDAGATADGQPYFVMELVKGVPITRFCDERKMTPRERLGLFIQVCQAIQHAHQKGVIHRDIKPSNVLVAMYDDRPVPKVIDFGVAKATGSQLTDQTLVTNFGAVVGTPEYMSPEQASFNQVDVDTRSDVYALGVLLYELLTGATPVDRKSLKQAAVLEILRIVREVEPPRPSDRLSTSNKLASVAANRQTEPMSLTKLLRGELDWVVMKALEKDRTRRYDTANALARDVQRYLADEIVEARPPSASYRLRKLLRRHTGKMIAGSLVLLALVGGIIGTSWGLLWAERERDHAVVAEGKAKDQARIAAEERDKFGAERDEKIKAVKVAQEQVVRLRVRTGQTAAEKGEGFGALHWFNAAWAADVDDPSRDRIHRIRLGAALQQLPTLQAVRFHDDTLAGAWLSPDGQGVLSYTKSGTRAFYWDVKTGRLKTPPLAHPSRVLQAEFNSDGSRILTRSTDEKIRIWDAGTGQMIGSPIRLADSARLIGASISPDGKQVLAAAQGGHRIDLIDVDGGTVSRSWKVAEDPVSLRFSPAGNRFACALDKTAVLWDLAKKEPLATLPHRAEPLFTGLSIPPANPSAPFLPVFSTDGLRLVTLTPGGHGFAVWDGQTGKAVWKPVTVGHTQGVALSRSGRLLLAAPNGSYKIGCTIHATETGALVSTIRPERYPTNGAFSPDERTLFLRLHGGEVCPFDVATGQPSGPPLSSSSGTMDVQIGPDSRTLLVGDADGIARVWKMPALESAADYDFTRGGPSDGQLVTADGSRRLTQQGVELAVQCSDGKLFGPPLRGSPVTHQAWLSPDAGRVAVADLVRGFTDCGTDGPESRSPTGSAPRAAPAGSASRRTASDSTRPTGPALGSSAGRPRMGSRSPRRICDTGLPMTASGPLA